jgi:outer membrane protein OmpA-like peptidoglycan-associated protein
MPAPGHLLAALLLLALAACGHRELVVLLPDEDGSVGTLVVAEEQREIVLDQPLQGVRAGFFATDREAVPPEEVETVFGRALAAAPPAPVTFILYFEEGSTELVPESAARLDEVFVALRERPAPEVEVVGHTDRTGPVASNDALARERAAVARDQLYAAYLAATAEPVVRAEKFVHSGRGEREPLVPTADEVAEPRNRRVEITIR